MNPEQQTPATPPQAPKEGYGKRPMWQWVVLYLVIAIVLYGLIYFIFFHHSTSSTGSGGFGY